MYCSQHFRVKNSSNLIHFSVILTVAVRRFSSEFQSSFDQNILKNRLKMIKTISENISKLSLNRKSSTSSVDKSSAEKTLPVPKHDIDTTFEKATFGMGCFWSCDSLYGAQKGVLRTKVGYTGGKLKDPVYRSLGDHTEAIEIHYDPTTITYEKLLNLFWNNHEYGLTTRIKKQYASIIFFHNEEQKRIAEQSRIDEQKARSKETIITEIVPAGIFYSAEDYHQKYRLQAHRKLASEVGLGPSARNLLQTSYLAAKLNGYLVGVGGAKQFSEEANELGLNERQIEYVMKHVKENEHGGLTC